MTGKHRPLRRLIFIASSRKDLIGFPDEARQDVGHALYLAQAGERAPAAKVLKGFGGGGVIEIVEDHDGDTYRCVYTVRLEHAVYVLHAFKKKSKRGAKTPKPDMDLIRSRLREAEEYDRTAFPPSKAAETPERSTS
ncbi:type II toxin-antitoxin system RelE/ParE family toxin [Methylobacterium oryzisoli]|uniref:type II toxin-antitoxin system RelE/ParE family toxin n=1 Tax=Methylobacterium oryzisoli TaxID=3385502 RepID=UPI0038913C45